MSQSYSIQITVFYSYLKSEITKIFCHIHSDGKYILSFGNCTKIVRDYRLVTV